MEGLYCVLGGRVTPSYGSFNDPFDRFECFDPGLNVWLSGPHLPIPVEEAGAVVLGGYLYVIGGRVTSTQVTASVYRLPYR